MFYGGVLMFGLGVFGDYWPAQNSYWVGVGFLFEMLGTPVLGVGSILYGLAMLKANAAPRWIGYGLLTITPLGVLVTIVLKHIPAGPLFGYVIFWLIVGLRFITPARSAPGSLTMAAEL